MDIQLKIDDFIFQGLEIPKSIPFGGQQILAIHRMIGGVRVIDSMGRDEDPLDWSGLFMGDNALARAKYLHALRVEGKPHILTWDSLSYTVIIRSFHADYERHSIIPYRISCEVVTDNSNPSVAKPPTDITKAIKEDIDAAIGAGRELVDPPTASAATAAAPQSRWDNIRKGLAAVKSAVDSVKNFVNATNAQIKAVKDAITDVQTQIQSEIASVTNQIQALTTLGGLIPGNSVSKGALKYGQTAAAVNNAYMLENLQYTLQRTQKNLTAVTSTPNAKTIKVSGTTLYKVAQEQYGDATLWSVIATANHMTDPTITGVVTLTIPPIQSISV